MPRPALPCDRCRPPTARDSAERLGGGAIAAWALGAITVLAALRAWQREAYWEHSDGVYALTVSVSAGA